VFLFIAAVTRLDQVLVYSSHRAAIAAALDGSADPNDSRFEWECRWGCDDFEWLRRLPAVASTRCAQSMQNGGACCLSTFETGETAEIHAHPLGRGRYKIYFYSALLCENPAFDPSAPASLENMERMPCEGAWPWRSASTS